MEAGTSHGQKKKTVCWAAPKYYDKLVYDDNSTQVGMMKIPNDMMQCKKTTEWLGLRNQKDCVLEI